MSFSRLFNVIGRQADSARAASQRVSSSSTRGSAMRITIFVLLLAIALSACAPAIVTAPAVTSTPATSIPPAVIPTNTAVPSPKPTASVATAVPDKPITLHLAVSDTQGRASEPYVLEFVDQVNTLSKGNITVIPVWDAGSDVTPPFAQGVIKIVKDGQYELGLAGAGAWDTAGATSFQALQAPFLITNDSLAEAVAASEIGKRMLEGLSSVGITGLGLWPEDLRHPFSMDPDKPILSPEDLKGSAVRTPPSAVSYMLIKALGGSPFFDNQTRDFPAAESGLLQAGSLPGTPTVTGNVTFFPKFQVLFVNGAAFEKLSEGQRSILREAAAATQKKAIAEHPKEADAAKAYCASGEKIVMASAEQVAVFEAAAKPVFAEIEKDPLNAELIAKIRELNANTHPAPGAEACQPAASPEVWSTGLPPNGAWQVELTAEDVIKMGVPQSGVKDWVGMFTWTFQDSKAQLDYKGPGGDFVCQANMEFVDDVARLTYFNGDACVNEGDDIQWRIDPDGLHLHLVAIQNSNYVNNRAMYEAKPWQKVVNP
jgi:TRAP-type C4-dicarboxylate transport system substrate-binding protein